MGARVSVMGFEKDATIGTAESEAKDVDIVATPISVPSNHLELQPHVTTTV
jgi:hypothetical protein